MPAGAYSRDRRIDWILVPAHLAFRDYGTLSTTGFSDHRAVAADLEWVGLAALDGDPRDWPS